MNGSYRRIIRWSLAIAFIFGSLQRSEGFRWRREPDNPKIVVEDGVNNKNVKLTWEFRLDNQEALVTVAFYRQKSGGSITTIASRLGQGSFNFPLNTDFASHYKANLKSELELLDVSNDEEYTYSIQVIYSLSGRSFIEPSQTSVIVRVPPRITKEPERNSRVYAGENLTLTCNASGDPMPNITWSREGATSNQLVNATGYELTLVNVSRQDVGSYRCTANNGYAPTASSLAIVNVKCSQCEIRTVGITITGGVVWTDSLRNDKSIEYKMLASNLTSAIMAPYSRPENQGKRPYEVAIQYFRDGSVIAVVQMQFPNDTSDPLQPLRSEVNDGRLGIFTVNRKLEIDPTTEPPTSTTDGSTASKEPPSDPAARTGLSDAAMWGIIGGCIAFALLVAIVILVCCLCRGGRCSCCRRTKSSGGATKGKKYTEADGYRMNRQPPPSGLGTASPAYVEARMYAPAHATKRQDDQTKYADLSFDQSSKPPPRYGSEVDYADVSPSKRPPPAAGSGGGQGEGGFELWC